MVNDRKIKKITKYFSRKREVEKKQLASFREQTGAVAGLHGHKIKTVKPFFSEILSESAKNSLIKKSEQSNIPFYILKEVYNRGFHTWVISEQKTPQQLGFERVNSFIAQGQNFFNEDEDLAEKAPCWKGFKQIGMKKKNNKEVPNCVPVKEQLDRKTLTAQQLAALHKLPIEKINAEIAKGEKVEMEHTKEKKTANQIARDHIKEDPRYYEKLKKMEKKPIKEDTPTNNAGGGAVRGMGYVSGSPGGDVSAYAAGNVSDTDQVQNLLFKLLKKYHYDLHPRGKK